MLKDNCTHLTRKQIENLIQNNGVKKDGTEYCLNALKTALIDKQEKANAKYLKSADAVTAQVNAALNAITILPPPMPKQFKKAAPIAPIKREVKFQLQGNKTFWSELTSESKNYWAAV